MEHYLIDLLKEYGYIVLFFWSILEGELGLIMAGTLCKTGYMSLPIAIMVAGTGAFIGDQIYFYIGRYSKKRIYKILSKHRRKFAIAHLLLKQYGWILIFLQRYLYGLRTVIPMSIGLTRYSSGKFAIINFISALIWASITIYLAYIFGDELLEILKWAKSHWYMAIPIIMIFMLLVYKITKKIEKNLEKRGK